MFLRPASVRLELTTERLTAASSAFELRGNIKQDIYKEDEKLFLSVVSQTVNNLS